MAQFLTFVGPASVAVFAVGCSGAVGGADLVVEQWVAAASSGDCAEMYELLDGTVQATLSAEAFSDWCAANREQLSQDASVIDAAGPELQVVATLAAYGGEPVQLVRERSGSGPWRLKERLVPPSGGHSPLELLGTLQSLVDSALMSHTLAVMTPEFQKDFLAELHLIRDAISRSDSAEVEVWADHAQISIGDTVVHLRRVNQAWQIQSVESNYYSGYDYY